MTAPPGTPLAFTGTALMPTTAAEAATPGSLPSAAS